MLSACGWPGHSLSQKSKTAMGLETTFLTIGTFRIAHHNFTWWTLQMFFIVFFVFLFWGEEDEEASEQLAWGLAFIESWGMWGGEVLRRMW